MPGNGIAERLRGFEIDHECKLARLLDREITGPGRPEQVISNPERHLVPSTLIRQKGCPNYMNFRMTLKPNPKSRFILAKQRRCAVADDEALKAKVKNDGKTIAEARTRKTAEDVAERLNAEEDSREDRWSA
jgi:hypothetical protein